jgi:plastocyanin
MTRLLLGGTAVLAALAVASSAAAATPKLAGTDGPGFTIKLASGGKKVTKLKAGKYTFAINDRSSAHNFALDGPNGFEKDITTVSFKGSKTFTVKLKPGTYKFYCAAHESSMFGHFKVS